MNALEELLEVVLDHEGILRLAEDLEEIRVAEEVEPSDTQQEEAQ